MKRLVTSLLLIPILAFGMADRRKQTAPTPTNTSTLDLATGQLTTSDYSGQSQSAAGNSRIADTGASTVGGKFADKSDPTMELAWFDINRAAEDQPDVAIDLQLANEHKSAVENVRQVASSPNISVAALDFAKEGLKAVQAKIAAREREKAARGRADTSAFRATAYLQGPGAVTSVAVMAGTMGAAVANGNEKRATYQSSINEKQIDTSNTNDYAGVNAALRTQLEMTKLELEIAKLKQAVTPAKPTPPVVNPTDPKPVDPVTPPPADGTGLSDEEAKKIISGLQFLDGTDRNHPQVLRLVKMYGGRITHFGGGNESNRAPDGSNLWKPDSDSDGNLVVITSSNVKAGAVTVGGETVSKMSIGNGWRPHFRFGKPGAGGYGPSPKVVVEGVGSATISNPGKKQTFKLTSTGPVDPPPSTSSLFILEPDKLTLRPDFAAAVRTIDVLTKINDPNVAGATNSVPSSVRVDAGKLGPYTWGIPKPLGSYPRGNMPNTWRIGLIPGKIPADVTYHRSIMQTFIQEGATKTFPPTTRK